MFTKTKRQKLGLRYRNLARIILASLALAGCVNDNVSDLQSYVQTIKAKKPAPIPPLPEAKSYETYVYDETTLRDPFHRSVRAPTITQTNNSFRPNMKRQREVLEQYPLDTLKLVGSLEQGGERWALVRSQDGTLYRTKKGRYIGQDYGEIIRVTESEIVLQETVPDGLGGWVRRQATLSVSE